MEFVSAICPHCNKKIKINPAEEVVFCDLCNKPFAVKDAIKLNEEYSNRNSAAKKPSDEAILKFNAILEQDYNLAETYFKSFVSKEYPQECQHLLIPYYRDFISFSDWERIHKLNPYIAEMHYKLLCKKINNEYKKRNNLYLNGELAFFKLFWLNHNEKTIKDGIESVVYMWDSDSYDGHDIYRGEEKVRSDWKIIESNIQKYHDAQHNRENNYDDDFIFFVINIFKHTVPYISVARKTFYSTESHPIKKYIFNLDESIGKLVALLEDCYSPNKKKAIKRQKDAERKRREEEARLKKEQQDKEALEKEIALWQQYIDLLKAGKAKKALALLKETNNPSNTEEVTKFKKGVLGVKYLGDVSLLQAKTLAELSLAESH